MPIMNSIQKHPKFNWKTPKTVARSKHFVVTSMSRQTLTVRMNAHIAIRLFLYIYICSQTSVYTLTSHSVNIENIRRQG